MQRRTLFLVLIWSSAVSAQIRIGLIGLDTSHAPAFTAIINDTSRDDHVAGARVVCAYRGGSPDVEASAARIDRFTAQIRDQHGVPIVPSIAELVSEVDAVILTSVDGRVHLDQARPVLAAGLPLFIDKPMAASLADVKTLFRLAEESGAPCFSASALRFIPEVQKVLADSSLGAVLGCFAYSPASLEPHHPDLFWYGVHGIEILFTFMGPDCREVIRIKQPDADAVTGVWEDGRLGIYRGGRAGKGGYGAMVFFERGIRHVEYGSGSLYRPLVKEIVKFFRSGVAPVSPEETTAIFAFMEGADQSVRLGSKIPMPR